MGNNYTFEGCTVKTMFRATDWDTTAEGILVDITGRRGTALVYLSVYEDASQANTEKLDVTVHNVASDSVTLDTTNDVASFTQIVGSNTTANLKTEAITVNLEGLEEQYLQCLLTETNTYEGFVFVVIVLPPTGYLPTDPD